MASPDHSPQKNLSSVPKPDTSPIPREQLSIDSPSNNLSQGRMTASGILPKNYGFSANHSASTLQHSTVAWGFSKATRFPKISSNPGLFDPPSTLNKKATSFGFGYKGEALDNTTKRAAQLPGPNKYTLRSTFQNDKAGRSFGLPFSVYAKTYIPEQTYLSPELARELPGPGAYYTARDPEPKKPRITIKHRGKMFNEALNIDSPPSSLYHPVMSLVESSRFKNTGFGFGEKHDFTKNTNGNPGPGSYQLPSCFDKSSKKGVGRMRKSAL